jgi:hypothetical protein
LGEAGSGGLASAAPGMIGDLGTLGAIALPGATPTARAPLPKAPAPPPPAPARNPSGALAALAAHGAFKISENESPRPQDRVFLTYNYFNSVNNFGAPSFDLHREVIGFERTFLGGDASFGVRLPFLEKDGPGSGVSVDGFGDLSLVFKYAAVNDPQTGNVLSCGLVVTLPTGRDIRLADGSNIQSVLLQPWLGGILNAGAFYVLGFSSAVIPTETRDASFVSNDLGVGYRLYQCCGDQLITQVIPTVEAHLVDPINHAGLNNPGALLGFTDQVSITAGTHFGLWNRAFLTLAGVVPVSGPRPFAGEFVAQLNWRF